VIVTLPWALLGMLALPALAAIYLFRSRSRPLQVSSLMLWVDATRAHEGGRILKTLHVPLLLVLELLAAALLVLAATDPRVQAGGAGPLMIVLDDSFSMQAGGEESPRGRTVRAVEHLLADEPGTPVQFLVARREPQLLGERVRGAARAAEVLARWECLSPISALDPALALAAQIGGPHARMLVMTDHAPADPDVRGRLLWRAFGRTRSNLAIVHAARSTDPARDRCLVEVANFAKGSRQVTVSVRHEGTDWSPARRGVALGPGGRQAVWFDLPPGSGLVRAVLPDDALAFDNEAALLPQQTTPVRVRLAVSNEPLAGAIRRGLAAAGRARITPRGPHLVITDRAPAETLPPETWTVQIVVDAEAEAFVGPYVLDRSHPLCAGLDLGGVIWAAAKTPPLPGTPVVSVGNVALVTETRRGDEGRHLRLRIQPDLSNLGRSTNWPVLVWNLLAYRAAHLPGLERVNVRLGSTVALVLPADVAEVEVFSPDGRTRRSAVHGRRVAVEAARLGLYEVRSGGATHRFAASALAPSESDLVACAAGEWGQWDRDDAARSGLRPLAWIAMLAALGVFVTHLALAGRSVKERTP